jgi:aminoglycoside 3-N-acetyltransferase
VIRSGDITLGAHQLGLGNLPVCVHSSLRSFGWVEGGADAVIDGLLAAGCTVMAPTFSLMYALSGPDDVGPAYAPGTPKMNVGLGAIPVALVRRPERVRSGHPLNSFSAVGPLAEELAGANVSDALYASFEALLALGGWVLLIGVPLRNMTLIHLAEQKVGRPLVNKWTMGADGLPRPVKVGGCGRGFPQLEPWLGRLARETFVGASRWRAFPAAETVAAAMAAMRVKPDVTHCGREICELCNAALRGQLAGPVAR